MANEHNNYNNNYFDRLIEFVQKQTAAQIEQKNAIKKIQDTVDDIKTCVFEILKKVTKVTTVVSIVFALLFVIWGYVSISMENLIQKSIEDCLKQEEQEILNQKKIEEIIIETLKSLNKDETS